MGKILKFHLSSEEVPTESSKKNSTLSCTLSFFPLPSTHGQEEAHVREGRVKFLSSASSSVDILTMEITTISR